MRRIIDTINNGQIERNFGTLTFSVSAVEHTISPGTSCEGAFSVMANTGYLTEGYVYADDYRMECITSEFSGTHDEIAYRFDGSGMSAGDDVRGEFNLVTNRGEYSIPFSIHVEEEIFESSLGPIRNLFHFANLAKAKWDEALKLFYDPRFINILTGSDRDYLALYRCLSGVSGSERNMDEFLVAIRKKNPIEFIPSETSVEYTDLEGECRFSLDITRNGWGYTHFAVECEGGFLSVQDADVPNEAFLGNKYKLYYFIDSSKLHNGHNFGAITLKNDRGDVRIPVTVNRTGEHFHLKDMTRFRIDHVVSLMENYEKHRLKQMSTRAWIAESRMIVEEMLGNDPEDLQARLYQIHLMITGEHNNEALWNLKKVKEQALSVRSENTYLWCYYLYLNSLIDESDMDVETLTEEVEYCYKTDPGNWRLCWLLSVMSDEYKNASKRWEMYEEAYERGCNSPAIYLEAAKLVLDNPEFISKVSGFDLQVIRYICKKNLMNDSLASVIRSIAERYKDYSVTLVRLLELSYKDNPNDEILSIICAQLIKGGRKDKTANIWYGYAIDRNLKITRLYEYYMMSVDKKTLKEIPRTVLLYFSFQSDLDYETNAFLYAYVVSKRGDDPEMYSKYQRQIEDYVSDQLAAKHNNRYLSMLYRNMITEEMLADPETAERVADIVFIHEVDASAYPDARYCVLSYANHDGEEKYPIEKGYAEIPIFSEEHSIAFEDVRKNRTACTDPSCIVRLIEPGRMLLNLQLLVRDHTGIDVYSCMEHRSMDVRPENEFRYRSLLSKGWFSKEYAKNVTMRLVRFYYEQDRIEELDALLESIEEDGISEYERAECIRFMIKRALYDKAVAWIYRFGSAGIDKTAISDLIYGWLPSHMDEIGEYEKMIVKLILDCIESGRMNNACIQYAIEHVEGPIRSLRDIWKKARETDVDCRELEERMILQILFSGAYIQERAQILHDYAYNRPDADVIRAALCAVGYDNFVDQAVISDESFDVMTEAYESNIKLDKVCDLAYVSHFAENRDRIDDRVRPILKDALHRLLAEDICISCFGELSDLMPSMAQFADVSIIEYRTTPGTDVNIHYCIESDEDDYRTEPMNEVCKGVYSKMFTVFFGERLMYYITEGSGDENDALSESNTITRNDMGDSSAKGRFGLIDDMCIGRMLKDYATVDELMEEYYRKEYISNRLFGLHKG